MTRNPSSPKQLLRSALGAQTVLKRAGLAAFVFFLAKGLAWVAIAVGGYSAMAD